MIRILFEIFLVFTTSEEVKISNHFWHDSPIHKRVYINKIFSDKISDFRFYLDTSVEGQDWITSFHFEGCGSKLNMWYGHTINWGFINGRFHFFAADHEPKYDPDAPPIEIKR